MPFDIEPSGPVALALVACAAIVAGIIAQAMLWWILRHVTRQLHGARILLRKTGGVVRVLLPLLFLQFVWTAAPDWRYMGAIAHFNVILLIVGVVALIQRAIGAAAEIIIAAQPLAERDNLTARRIHTQTQVISRSIKFLVVLVGVGVVLMTFPGARALGTSLLASAGLAGIVAGVAARPVLSNLIAGLQIALSQPLRIDDVLIVAGEWGRVEEITTAYVVMRLWDDRRLIVPLQWFIENPFQNWTRSSAALTGAVYWWVDYRMPLGPLRDELRRVCEQSADWDGRHCGLQVTDTSDRAVQIRALVTAEDSGRVFNLRCEAREALIDFMQREYPDFLPAQRNLVSAQWLGSTTDQPVGTPA